MSTNLSTGCGAGEADSGYKWSERGHYGGVVEIGCQVGRGGTPGVARPVAMRIIPLSIRKF